MTINALKNHFNYDSSSDTTDSPDTSSSGFSNGLDPSFAHFGLPSALTGAAPSESSPAGLSDPYLLTDGGDLSPLSAVRGLPNNGGSSGPTSKPAPIVAPAPTLIGTSGGLEFNLVWDSSVASAPSAFMSAVEAAAKLYTTLFSNKEVINVHVGFGEVGGTTLPSYALAASESAGYMTNYATVDAALQGDKSSSSYQATADATLTSADPTKGGQFFVTSAEAKALGLVSGSGAGVDGYIGLSAGPSFDYTAGTKPAAGQYDAIGAIEHELSEVMGRLGSVGSLFGSNVYTPLDLFRYSSAGVHDTKAGPGYFSVNGGATNLGAYNNPLNGGDAADWIPTLIGDSYGDGYSGRTAAVSSTDIIEVATLGYKMTATALADTKTPGLA